MTSQFDNIVDRRHTNSMKWDVADHELPMWVADMDFPTAPVVHEAIIRRANHGIFGYTDVPSDFSQALCWWWRERHGWHIQPEWLHFCTGVVPALSSMVRSLTDVGDRIAVITPAYNIFFHSILNSNRQVAPCDLRYDNGEYSVDFPALEATLADPKVTLLILCNPHNPVGILWDRQTLERIGDMCDRHKVTVISDEIHCDISAPNCSYIPFAAASPTCSRISAICLSASKAFNIAGIQAAAVVVPNAQLREDIVRGLHRDEVAEPNVFAIDATVAAFSPRGAQWLDSLRRYLWENRRYAEDYLAKYLPVVRAIPAQATYLLWLDCSAITTDSTKLAACIRKTSGLVLSDGAIFRGNGQEFLRLNLACPRSQLDDGLQRLRTGVLAYLAQA
ncbi:MalY/PatB family protein [Trueperella sp. LYQ141]|uniref:MalY/PatB family protein n=1 Tax=Trueperella sp. LYQ141 TaxID=3391058 RepID=UPI003983B2DF